MRYTIQQIADGLGATAVGDPSLTVIGAAEPAAARADQIALAMQPAYAQMLGQGGAQAALLWADADWQAFGLTAAILVPRPRFALAGLSALFDPGPQIAPGIHPSAVIDPGAQIGDGAAIGPFVHVARGAVIGTGARIAAHASIAEDAQIGDDALILQGVRIGARVRIGNRFICQPNAVIGGDGFSFVTPEKSAVEAVRETLGDAGQHRQQAYARIHSLGAVEIGDDVEVGANACIDRGTVADTVIGRGTKIDNLVQVGHNVRVGEDCLLCGQTGIAGSTVLGDRCVMAGQVGITDHLNIGNDVVAGAGTLLRTNQPDGRVMLGNPAMPMQASIDSYKALRRLPRMLRDIADLRSRLSKQADSD